MEQALAFFTGVIGTLILFGIVKHILINIYRERERERGRGGGREGERLILIF